MLFEERLHQISESNELSSQRSQEKKYFEQSTIYESRIEIGRLPSNVDKKWTYVLEQVSLV